MRQLREFRYYEHVINKTNAPQRDQSLQLKNTNAYEQVRVQTRNLLTEINLAQWIYTCTINMYIFTRFVVSLSRVGKIRCDPNLFHNNFNESFRMMSASWRWFVAMNKKTRVGFFIFRITFVFFLGEPDDPTSDDVHEFFNAAPVVWTTCVLFILSFSMETGLSNFVFFFFFLFIAVFQHISTLPAYIKVLYYLFLTWY